MRVTKNRVLVDGNGDLILSKEYCKNCTKLKARALNSPEVVVAISKDLLLMDRYAEEHMYMFCLNTKCKLICIFEVSSGDINSSIFDKRGILQKALLANAVTIILVHNHPSGDTTPSSNDISATKDFKQACELIGIKLADHIIIGETYYSFKEGGII